jgi:sulfur-carrier protein adenylyltransferase/sulfurtransferase
MDVIAYNLLHMFRSFYFNGNRKTVYKRIIEQYLINGPGNEKMIFKLFQSLSADSPYREDFEREISCEYIEGGLTAQELLDKYAKHLKETVGALDLALTIEAQALDLYLRFVDRTDGQEVRTVVFQIADDEKIYLRHLAEMMGRKV